MYYLSTLMIQFSVCCLTAVRRKAERFGAAMQESCCRAGCAQALWELGCTDKFRDKIWVWLTPRALLWGGSRICAVPSVRRLQGVQVTAWGAPPSTPWLPLGVLGLGSCCCLPQHPSSTQVWIVSVELHCTSRSRSGCHLNHLCLWGSVGLWTLGWMLVQGSLPSSCLVVLYYILLYYYSVV